MQKIGLISKKFNEILRFENFETTLTNIKFHNSLHLCENLCLSIHVASVPSLNLTCVFLPPMCVFLHHPCAFLCHPLLFRFSEKLYVRLSVPPPLFFIIPLSLSSLQVKSLHEKLRLGWCAFYVV